MAVLVIVREGDKRPLTVDFDPSKESQEDVEHRHGVSYSDYYEDRDHAERALEMVNPRWY